MKNLSVIFLKSFLVIILFANLSPLRRNSDLIFAETKAPPYLSLLPDGRIDISPVTSKIIYDIENRFLMAMVTCELEIAKYWLVNDVAVIAENTWKTRLSIDGKDNLQTIPSSVHIKAGIFSVKYRAENVKCEANIFCEQDTNVIFLQMKFVPEDKRNHTVHLSFDIGFDLGNKEEVSVCYDADLKAQIAERAYGDKAAIVGANIVPGENSNKEVHLNNWRCQLAYVIKLSGEPFSFVLALTGGASEDSEKELFSAVMKNPEGYFLRAKQRAERINSYFLAKDLLLKSMFVACVDTALSSYKTTPDGTFRAFFAGVKYREPARTYFRDSYWTVQSVLPFDRGLVREQVFTLARGVHKNGQCPSGVKFDGSDWSSDHYDSPSYFVMIVYDYLCWSGDFEILDEIVENTSVWEKIQLCLNYLTETDRNENYLMEKPLNCSRDWADNVFRDPEVTYDEALYYRALDCASQIAILRRDDQLAEKYRSLQIRVKDSINKLLWDEKLGHYIDYSRDMEHTENHLSEDTFLTLLYGIADESKREKFFMQARELLESKRNSLQPMGDWGTLCCFPLYQFNSDIPKKGQWKSCYPYCYHNGADWPYLSGINALVRMWYRNPDWKYPLTRWWRYSLEKGWLAPVEYYSPPPPGIPENLFPDYTGGFRQAWSSMPAAAIIYGGFGFWPDLQGSVGVGVAPWAESQLTVTHRGNVYKILSNDTEASLFQNGKLLVRIEDSSRIRVLKLGEKRMEISGAPLDCHVWFPEKIKEICEKEKGILSSYTGKNSFLAKKEKEYTVSFY